MVLVQALALRLLKKKSSQTQLQTRVGEVYVSGQSSRLSGQQQGTILFIDSETNIEWRELL